MRDDQLRWAGPGWAGDAGKRWRYRSGQVRSGSYKTWERKERCWVGSRVGIGLLNRGPARVILVRYAVNWDRRPALHFDFFPQEEFQERHMRPVVVLQDATADSDARRDETRRDKTRQDEMQSAVPRAWDRSCITVTLDIGSCDGEVGPLKVLKPHGPLNLIEPRVTTSPVAVVLWGSCLGVLALSGTLAHT